MATGDEVSSSVPFQCHKGCDVCRSKVKVQAMVGKLEQYYSFPSRTSIAPAKAEGGNELYGGGRQGAKEM